jgi:hypothetical protein
MLHWHGVDPNKITDDEALKRHKSGQTACSDCPKPAGCKASPKMLAKREAIRFAKFQAATYDPREDKK